MIGLQRHAETPVNESLRTMAPIEHESGRSIIRTPLLAQGPDLAPIEHQDSIRFSACARRADAVDRRERAAATSKDVPDASHTAYGAGHPGHRVIWRPFLRVAKVNDLWKEAPVIRSQPVIHVVHRLTTIKNKRFFL